MNWEYIAGFMDGEGCVSRQTTKEGKFKRYEIQITNTNYDVLIKMKDFVEMGWICKLKTRKAHWKQAWSWGINRHADVIRFCEMVENFSIVKKEKITNAKMETIEYVKMREEYEKKRRQKIIDDINNTFEDGISISEISRRIGVSRPTVRRYMDKYGIN